MTNDVDLYRQMLRGANKVADNKLARLLQKRLSSYIKTSRGRCHNIIPFPAALVEGQRSMRHDLYAKRSKMPTSL